MVIIKTMEHLPETCSECPCFVDVAEYGECCVLYDRHHDGSAIDRVKHCPLEEKEENPVCTSDHAWIPVTERLPEIECSYLIVDEHGEVHEAEYFNGEWVDPIE